MPLWIFAALLLAALLVISLLAQPIADDIWSLAYVPHQSALHYIYDFYVYHSGRYANAIVMVLGIKLFGVLAVKIVPMLEIAAIGSALVWLIWQILEDKPRRLERAIVLGITSTGVYLLVVPSIFDTIAWYTASTVYVPAVIGMVLTAALYTFLYKHPLQAWYYYALLALLVFFSQGFNEPAAIITCLVASLLLLGALVRKSKTIPIAITMWASAAVGLATVYFSPGTHTRVAAQQAALHFHSVFIGALHDFWYTKQTLLSWRIALIAVLGLAFALTLPIVSKLRRKWLAGIGLAFCVVPTYITGLATHYANSAEGGITEMRTATVPFVYLVAGLVCLVIVLVHSMPWHVQRWLPVVLYVAIPISLVVSLQPVLNVVRAEILRDSLFRYRETSIQMQKAAHQQTVYVIPAPILLGDSQAADLSYIGNHQIDWFNIAFADYYGLYGKIIKIVSTPPSGYCLTHSDASWQGAPTCQDAAMQQEQALPYTLKLPVNR